MVSPRSPPLTRAARARHRPGGAGQVQVLAKLAEGERRFDVLATPPDGLVSSRLLDRFGASPTGEVGAEIGAVGTCAGHAREAAAGRRTPARRNPVARQVALRPDLAKTGVLLPRQLAAIEASSPARR